MEENKYIAGKKNSVQAKTDRKLWIEEKVRNYQQEAKDIDIELHRDLAVIEDLTNIAREIDEKTQALEKARTEVMVSASEDVLDVFLTLKAEIAELEAKMRMKYYAR